MFHDDKGKDDLSFPKSMREINKREREKRKRRKE
jgi:hypothetical protein